MSIIDYKCIAGGRTYVTDFQHMVISICNTMDAGHDFPDTSNTGKFLSIVVSYIMLSGQIVFHVAFDVHRVEESVSVALEYTSTWSN